MVASVNKPKLKLVGASRLQNPNAKDGQPITNSQLSFDFCQSNNFHSLVVHFLCIGLALAPISGVLLTTSNLVLPDLNW